MEPPPHSLWLKGQGVLGPCDPLCILLWPQKDKNKTISAEDVKGSLVQQVFSFMLIYTRHTGGTWNLHSYRT